jgi:hypothetical protein
MAVPTRGPGPKDSKRDRRPDDWLGAYIFRSRVSALGSRVRVIRCRFGFGAWDLYLHLKT